jgi:hypothetical protein
MPTPEISRPFGRAARLFRKRYRDAGPSVVERMALVQRIASEVGVVELAREAGLPKSTVRSYAKRGWTNKYLPICDKLIAAAERLERSRRAPDAA